MDPELPEPDLSGLGDIDSLVVRVRIPRRRQDAHAVGRGEADPTPASPVLGTAPTAGGGARGRGLAERAVAGRGPWFGWRAPLGCVPCTPGGCRRCCGKVVGPVLSRWSIMRDLLYLSESKIQALIPRHCRAVSWRRLGFETGFDVGIATGKATLNPSR